MADCESTLKISILQSAICALDEGHEGRHRFVLEWDDDGRMHPQGILVMREPVKWDVRSLPQASTVTSAWSAFR